MYLTQGYPLICLNTRIKNFEGTSFMKFIEKNLLSDFRINPSHVLVMNNSGYHHQKYVISLKEKNINYHVALKKVQKKIILPILNRFFHLFTKVQETEMSKILEYGGIWITK